MAVYMQTCLRGGGPRRHSRVLPQHPELLPQHPELLPLQPGLLGASVRATSFGNLRFHQHGRELFWHFLLNAFQKRFGEKGGRDGVLAESVFRYRSTASWVPGLFWRQNAAICSMDYYLEDTSSLIYSLVKQFSIILKNLSKPFSYEEITRQFRCLQKEGGFTSLTGSCQHVTCVFTHRGVCVSNHSVPTLTLASIWHYGLGGGRGLCCAFFVP